MLGEVAAVGSLSLTLGLVITRPRLGRSGNLRVGPALAAGAGVGLLAVFGFVGPSDARDAFDVLWRPLLTISAIMLTTAVAQRLGVIDAIAARVFPRAEGSPQRLFALVFATSAATSAVLNNDAAVLLLTPLVVLLVRRAYPQDPALVVPFAFGVFMAAGVAPLVTSNPMNLIVADYASLDFNEYAVRMLPISVAGWLVTYLVLAYAFRTVLRAAHPARDLQAPAVARWSAGEIHGLLLVFGVLGAYPIVSYFDGSVWIVAAAGALVGLVLVRRHTGAAPTTVTREGIAWEILVFLFGVFVLALGLRNAGVVAWLTDVYEGAGVVVIGSVSAVGSALINNHSMALTNLLAIDAVPGAGKQEYLAALIGGDLGPRLLPIGSLAGLLWLTSLRRLGVEVPLGRFVLLGAAVTVPTLAVSLGLLALVV